MQQFELSKHALEQIIARGISEAIIIEVLHSPDFIETEDAEQLIYQKKVIFETGKEYLVRVFVNSNKTPNLVKTAYRTSKFSKYE